jgi:hypothetical protein
MFHKPISTDAREDRNHLITALGREGYVDHVWQVRENEWLKAQGLAQVPRPRSSSAWPLQVNAAAKIAAHAIGMGLRGLREGGAAAIPRELSYPAYGHPALRGSAQILSLPQK